MNLLNCVAAMKKKEKKKKKEICEKFRPIPLGWAAALVHPSRIFSHSRSGILGGYLPNFGSEAVDFSRLRALSWVGKMNRSIRIFSAGKGRAAPFPFLLWSPSRVCSPPPRFSSSAPLLLLCASFSVIPWCPPRCPPSSSSDQARSDSSSPYTYGELVNLCFIGCVFVSRVVLWWWWLGFHGWVS